MKLSHRALVEIMDILRKGLVENMDISQLLRELDLSPKDDMLDLSEDYLKDHPREGEWN